MTQRNTLLARPIDTTALMKLMLLGGGFAFFLISLMLSQVTNMDPNWPKLWFIKPMVVVPVAGACGGAFSYAMSQLNLQSGWQKIAAVIVCLIVYVFCLWMGTVLGLNGTLWD